jgi:hypothetical protein
VALAEEALPTVLESINKAQAKVAFPGSSTEAVAEVTPIHAAPSHPSQRPAPAAVPGATLQGDDHLWRDLSDNFGQWWDNRKDKRNPRAPDFKRKNDGEALWLDSKSTPTWAKQQFGG